MGSGISNHRSLRHLSDKRAVEQEIDSKSILPEPTVVTSGHLSLSVGKNTFVDAEAGEKDGCIDDGGTHHATRSSSSYNYENNHDEYETRSEEASAELFANTALSLGMDNDDLLFNLMYFDDGNVPSFGSMMDSVQHETLALHSNNNTPYKLRPASESVIAGLSSEAFVPAAGEALDCAVCREEMESLCAVIRAPACTHCFHEECLVRWIKLQGWCPVCRADICVSAEVDENICAEGTEGGDGRDGVQGDSACLLDREVSKRLFHEEEDTIGGTVVSET